MRKRIFEIIELAQDNDHASSIYDSIMMASILLSLIPLAFKTTNSVFRTIESIATVIFIADYLLRLLTADLKLKKESSLSCFTPSRQWLS